MGSFDLQGELATSTPEERGTKLHDEDEYNFGVKSAKDEGESKNGSPTLALQVEFLDGPYRGHTVSKRIYYSNRTQAGIRMFWQQLKALGLTEDYLVSTGQTRFDQIALLVQGAQFIGRIKHREYPPDSGVFQEEVNVNKPISNPNVGGGALTGVAQPPVVAGPEPEIFDEDEPAEPAKETVTASASTDDPWGAAE